MTTAKAGPVTLPTQSTRPTLLSPPRFPPSSTNMLLLRSHDPAAPRTPPGDTLQKDSPSASWPPATPTLWAVLLNDALLLPRRPHPPPAQPPAEDVRLKNAPADKKPHIATSACRMGAPMEELQVDGEDHGHCTPLYTE